MTDQVLSPFLVGWLAGPPAVRLGGFYLWLLTLRAPPIPIAAMKAHILQHVPFEGPGSILHWLQQRDAAISYSHLYEPTATLPNCKEIDLLIIMGGPMSVNDENRYPWLVAEKQLIAEAISAGVAVLGICLGAQLIASACGANVYQGAGKEIGWWPVDAVPHENAFNFPRQSTVFHWHGETFDLPEGAQRLARTDVCQNQAFQLGSNVIGLQFHLETTPDSAAAIIEHCGDELVDGKKIQTAAAMLSEGPEHYPAIHSLMATLLDYLTPRFSENFESKAKL